jgi:alpha-beta hydrolase superfamily lysophospholipase
VSRYKFDANDILVTGYKFYALQWRGPGLSPVTKLSWVQEQVAKLVTNLLILLSVLGGRSNYYVLVIICLLGDCLKFI